MIRERRHAHLS